MHDHERLRRSALDGDLEAARALLGALQRTGDVAAVRGALDGIARPVGDWLSPGSPCERLIFTALIDAVLVELETLHGRGVAHGALDPRRIFVHQREPRRPFEPPAFLCLGLGAPTDGPCVRYASPERLLGEPAAPSDDVFSVGVLLYELYAGNSPWLGDDAEVRRARCASEPPHHPAAWLPDEARHLGCESVALRSIARARDERFHDGAAQREALQQAARRAPMLIEQSALGAGPGGLPEGVVPLAPAYGMPPGPGGRGVFGFLRRLFGGS